MRIKSLKLLNFRNYKELNLDFSEGINIFIGENGVGKTNILEAIYVLSLTKSNRYGTNLDLINHQEESTSLIGEVDYLDYLKRYQVDISKNSKKVYINNQEIKRITDYISNFCVTTFMPSDIDIIKGSPSTRRNLLNIQIGELYNNYLKYVNEYNKYNYVVVNDNIIDATNKVDAILLASKCSVDRIESLDLQTEEEIIHEILIS